MIRLLLLLRSVRRPRRLKPQLSYHRRCWQVSGSRLHRSLYCVALFTRCHSCSLTAALCRVVLRCVVCESVRGRSTVQFVRGPFPRSLEGGTAADTAATEHSMSAQHSHSRGSRSHLRAACPLTVPSLLPCVLCVSPCGDHNFVYSSNGALLCALTASSADVYDCTVWPPTLRFSVPRPAVVHCCFSPRSSFLVTYERKSQQQTGENLNVWATHSGELVLAFFQSREVNVECWPLQWTSDEKLLCRQVSNELHVHSGPQPTTTVLARLHAANLSQFSVGPSSQSPYHIALFSPVRATDPARIAVHSLDSSLASNALLSRSVYKAEEMSIRWSASGLACLVETTTATDTSGKSYFGSSHLHLFSLLDSAPFTSTVEFAGNDGPVHDFCFLPGPRHEFMVVQGYQPALSTLFSVQSGACAPIKQYGRAPRNTVRVSPHGRFLMLGGFGNLSGEMDLSETHHFAPHTVHEHTVSAVQHGSTPPRIIRHAVDSLTASLCAHRLSSVLCRCAVPLLRFDSWKFKRIGECADRDGAKSYQWSNDSRHLVLAVLRPWRRVLNGYKVFDYRSHAALSERRTHRYHTTAMHESNPLIATPAVVLPLLCRAAVSSCSTGSTMSCTRWRCSQ